MLVDVNLLLYTVDNRSPHHAAAASWLTVCSADTDFARFPEIHWLNPLAPPSGRPRPRRRA